MATAEDFNVSGSWIDKKFAEGVLCNNLKKEVSVDDVIIQPGVCLGDNYLSILYKTTVKYRIQDSDIQQEKNFMIKGLPTGKILIDMVDGMGIFRKELAMYNECLPAMHRLVRQYFPSGTPYVGPVSYECYRENTLVMEDLGEDDYRMAKSNNQLDFEHSIATLRTLARFHALSVKIHKEHPEYIANCGSELYVDENKAMLKDYLEAAFPPLAALLESRGKDAKHCQILNTIGDHFYERLQELVRPSEKLNVFNHGDVWVNNTMYKYNEEGNIVHCKLVDFQVLRYTTPALDLLYFLFTSVNPEVVLNQMDELIELYHKAFTDDLKTLEVDVDYSLDKLKEDMRDRAAFALLAIVQILPVVVAPPSVDVDLSDHNPDEEIDNEHPIMKNLKNPAYLELASQFLDHLDKLGYLDEAIKRTQQVVDSSIAEEAEADKKEKRPKVTRRMLSRLRSTVWRLIGEPIYN